MNVSFGRVTAVTGSATKIKKINSRLQYKATLGQVVMKDVTSKYENPSIDGMFSSAVKKGDKVQIYITGDDIKKINKEPYWTTIDGIMSHVTSFFDTASCSVGEAIDKIMKG